MNTAIAHPDFLSINSFCSSISNTKTSPLSFISHKTLSKTQISHSLKSPQFRLNHVFSSLDSAHFIVEDDLQAFLNVCLFSPMIFIKWVWIYSPIESWNFTPFKCWIIYPFDLNSFFWQILPSDLRHVLLTDPKRSQLLEVSFQKFWLWRYFSEKIISNCI